VRKPFICWWRHCGRHFKSLFGVIRHLETHGQKVTVTEIPVPEDLLARAEYMNQRTGLGLPPAPVLKS
jgi:hypothetical protein